MPAIKSFIRDEDGAALVEYSVLIGLITVGAIAAIGVTATTVVGKWTALNAVFK